MNTNIKVIGLTRLGIKLESTTFEEDALATRPSNTVSIMKIWFCGVTLLIVAT